MGVICNFHLLLAPAHLFVFFTWVGDSFQPYLIEIRWVFTNNKKRMFIMKSSSAWIFLCDLVLKCNVEAVKHGHWSCFCLTPEGRRWDYFRRCAQPQFFPPTSLTHSASVSPERCCRSLSSSSCLFHTHTAAVKMVSSFHTNQLYWVIL